MRVVVAEDVMLTREGITRLLTDACVDVVGEAGDAASLLREVRMTRPDAAVVDIRMPPTHTDEGLVAAQQIRAEHPDIRVLIAGRRPPGRAAQPRAGSRAAARCRSQILNARR
jgi:DNA-binding NarL/FixJ family response regulator